MDFYNYYFFKDNKEKVMIDKKFGDVTGDGILDNIFLFGDRLNKENNDLIGNLVLVIMDGHTGKKTFIKIKGESGKNFNLFLGSFRQSNIDDILIRGDSKNINGNTYNHIYSYINNEFKEIFNGEKFYEQYILYIKDKCSKLFKLIYDEEKYGQVCVSHINQMYPIKENSDECYKLYVIQQIKSKENLNNIANFETKLLWDKFKFVPQIKAIAILS